MNNYEYINPNNAANATEICFIKKEREYSLKFITSLKGNTIIATEETQLIYVSEQNEEYGKIPKVLEEHFNKQNENETLILYTNKKSPQELYKNSINNFSI